jgi:cellulose synthase (UDP-forming)
MAQSRKRLFLDLLIVLALIAIAVYVIVRISLYFTPDYQWHEKILSALLMWAELFVLLHCVGYTINVLHVMLKKDDILPVYPPLKEEPSVAILVAARHEPKDVLEKTFDALTSINYSNKKVYFLDDSSEGKYKKEAEEICQRYGLQLFRREPRHGAKAGIINDCLTKLDQKYVAIFDADQCPLAEFLNVLIPCLESDDRLGFVQTPQFYSNIHESHVAKGSSFQQAIFYEYICEGKDVGGSMFCCGTNIVFRREALVDVGGFDETTVTEDIATSVKIHSKGWKSIYYGHVCTFGMGPENLTGYFKQQFRWSTGTLSVGKKLLWRFFTRPFTLKPLQWWEYLLANSYYFIGCAFFILMLCPILYIFFNVPTYFGEPKIYFLAFIPYFGLSMTIFYMALARRHYRIRDILLGQMLNAITFSVFIRGAFSAILGMKIEFGITQKTKGKPIPYIELWPQITMMFLNLAAVVWAINRFIYEQQAALLVNAFWALYHGVLLSSIFYFNDEDITKTDCLRLRRGVKFEYKKTAESSGFDALDKTAWVHTFSVFLPEPIKVGTLIWGKLKSSHSVVFDGRVIWCSSKKYLRGWKVDIGIVTLPEMDREKIKHLLI